MRRLEEDDRRRCGERDHALWHCRSAALALSDAVMVDIMAFDDRWRPIELDPDRLVRTGDPKRLGYRIGRKIFFDEGFDRIPEPMGIDGTPFCLYRPQRLLEDDELADAAFVARLEAAEGDQDDAWME